MDNAVHNSTIKFDVHAHNYYLWYNNIELQITATWTYIVIIIPKTPLPNPIQLSQLVHMAWPMQAGHSKGLPSQCCLTGDNAGTTHDLTYLRPPSHACMHTCTYAYTCIVTVYNSLTWLRAQVIRVLRIHVDLTLYASKVGSGSGVLAQAVCAMCCHNGAWKVKLERTCMCHLLGLV